MFSGWNCRRQAQKRAQCKCSAATLTFYQARASVQMARPHRPSAHFLSGVRALQLHLARPLRSLVPEHLGVDDVLLHGFAFQAAAAEVPPHIAEALIFLFLAQRWLCRPRPAARWTGGGLRWSLTQRLATWRSGS